MGATVNQGTNQLHHSTRTQNRFAYVNLGTTQGSNLPSFLPTEVVLEVGGRPNHRSRCRPKPTARKVTNLWTTPR